MDLAVEDTVSTAPGSYPAHLCTKKHHDLREDELVSAIAIPPDGRGWNEGFLKKSARGSVYFAVASLSVRLKMKGSFVADARIALNGVSTTPVRPAEAENSLKGKRIDEATVKQTAETALKEIKPLSLIGASAFLRRNVIRAMFENAFDTLLVIEVGLSATSKTTILEAHLQLLPKYGYSARSGIIITQHRVSTFCLKKWDEILLNDWLVNRMITGNR